MQKKPALYNSPSFSKRPRTEQSKERFQNLIPAWHFNSIDLTHRKCGWNAVSRETVQNDIHPKLKSFECMTWSEILARNNHEVEISQISSEAQKRLRELKHDDLENLIR